MELGKISTLAFNRMKRRGISLATLRHLLAHGHVEEQYDGARLVYLDSTLPHPIRDGSPRRTLYAVLDAAGEVLTVEKRVRL
jgi:hypothetical protein